MECLADSFAEELAKLTEDRAGPVARVQRRKRMQKQSERALANLILLKER